MSVFGEYGARPGAGRRWDPLGPAAGMALRAASPWVALAALGIALAALLTRVPEDRTAPESGLPGLVAAEALDTLAFRIALLERRAGAEAWVPPEAGARGFLTLLALQEVAERVERGLPFDSLLPVLQATAPPAIVSSLQTLALHAPRGVATLRQLEADFARLRPMLESHAAQADVPGIQRVLGLVQGIAADLHLVERRPANAMALAVARIGVALSEERLGSVLAEAAALDGTAQQMAGGWLMAVRARDDVLSSIAESRRSTWQALARSP